LPAHTAWNNDQEVLIVCAQGLSIGEISPFHSKSPGMGFWSVMGLISTVDFRFARDSGGIRGGTSMYRPPYGATPTRCTSAPAPKHYRYTPLIPQRLLD
jgi:hypothetical protein